MPPTDLSLARRVDTACDRFEEAWHAGKKPRIEGFLGTATGTDRADLLKALIAVEVELRRAAGEEVKAAPYRKRFADDADAVASAFAEPRRPRAAGETSVSRESVETGNFEARTETAKPDATVPKQIGRFSVVGVLGAGAFGRVYRAKDPQLGRDVAIKVPLASAIATTADRERFLREARAAAGLHHPNICPVHEVGEENGHPFIVMGYVPGQSLAATLKSRKEPLAAKQAALIARKLALALDVAHKKGIVHRDLKPANVMFDKERRDVVVTDFGLARAPRLDDAQTTRDGVLMGTPAYMSPEQARGDTKAVGPASDQYALGVMLFEMLTGRRPFTGTVTEVLGKILHVEPESPTTLRPGLDQGLAAICLKAMAKDPAARYASMREFGDALQGFASDVPARPAGAPATASAETAKGATETQRIADVFAFTEQAVEKAIRKHRTPTWMKVGIGVLILIGLLVPGIIFFAKTKSATVLITVDVDLSDKTLTFFLDGKSISAEQLAKPVELTLGEHELIVKRGKTVVKRMLFGVRGGRNAGIDIREVEEVPPPPSDDLRQLQGEWDTVAEEIQGQPIEEERIRQMAKRISIVDNRMTFHRANEKGIQIFREGTIQLNQNATPKTWDFKGIDYDGKPIAFRGLYELNGDTLRTVYNTKLVSEGAPVRPTEFRTAPGTTTLITVAKRRTQPPTEQGFVPLFNGKDLTGWTVESGDAENWKVLDGAIVATHGLDKDRKVWTGEPKHETWLLSEKSYGDCIVRFEFLAESPGVHSGFGFRSVPSEKPPAAKAGTFPFPSHLQVHIFGEATDEPSKLLTGTVLGLGPQVSLTSRPVGKQRPVGEWNQMEVEVRGQSIRVRLNGALILDGSLDDLIARGGRFPGLQRRVGRIGFQRLGGTVRFRSILIKSLDEVGFVPIFNGKDFTNWQGEDGNPVKRGWVIRDNAIVRAKATPMSPDIRETMRESIWTTKRFGDFVLELEFQTDGNSGVHVWTDDPKNSFQTGIEMQINSPNNTLDKSSVGAFYGLRAPSKQNVRTGDWNTARITAKSGKLIVAINGETVNEMDLDDWNEVGKNPDLTPNNYKSAIKNLRRVGHIGLQAHNGLISFRNIRIKELSPILPESKAKDQPAKDEERAFAEWLFSIGVLDIKLRVNGGPERNVNQAVDLPKESFRVTTFDARERLTDENVGPLLRWYERWQVGGVTFFVSPIGDATVRRVVKLGAMKNLVLAYSKITSACVPDLATRPDLILLDLGGIPINDADLEKLQTLVNLHVLALASTKVTDAGLKHLRGMKALRALVLNSTAITSAGLDELIGLPLESLSIAESQVRGTEGIGRLKNFPKLVHIDLHGLQLTDADLKPLAECRWLEKVDLRDNPLTDAGLAEVAKIPDLKWLNLDRTAVSDAGLKTLAGLKNLRELSLAGTKITPAAIAEFQRDHPKCKITGPK